MKLTFFFLMALLSTSAWCEERPAPTPPSTTQEFTLEPGLNAVPITRFPLLGPDGAVGEKLTLAGVFGPNNEAGLGAGDANSADIVWVSTANGEWEQLYFSSNRVTPVGARNGWRSVSAGEEDFSDFSWPFTAGVMIERRQKEPISIAFKGAPRLTETVLQINRGSNYFNRVYDVKWTLVDLELEAFFVRVPEQAIARPQVDPTGNAVEVLADQFVHPSTGDHYVLTEEGVWFHMDTRMPVDPGLIEVLGTFGIYRFGEPTTLSLPAPPIPQPAIAQLRPSPFLGLEEGAIRQLQGKDLGRPECVCAFLLHDNRPISLHVSESSGSHVVVRVGKHPENVITDSIAVVNGRGVNGPLEDVSPFFGIEQSVWSFSSNAPISDPLPYRARLADPDQRDGERRFFSDLAPDGTLFLDLDQLQWQANTLLEIDFIAATPNNRKIALHLPQVRVQEDASPAEFVEELAGLLVDTLVQRELVPPDNLSLAFREHPDGASLTLNFGAPLLLGKVDLCALAPVEPPVIEATSSDASVNGLVQIIGRDFGKRIEDLCVVLAPIDGSGRTIPLRPVSLDADGTSILARVVGPIPNGRLLRVMMARGIGRTQPVDLGFPDVLQRQGVWVWRGIGIEPTAGPNAVRPALGLGETMYFTGDLVDGNLVVTLDQPWPDNAKVSISFTASTETVQLDSYAPELYFTVSGSTEECAKRIRQAIKAAFIQGGMANANQIQVQVGVGVGNEVTLSAGIVNDDGVISPITTGHLIISVTEEEIEKEPPHAEDTDGDLVEDNWETNNFGMPAAEVSAIADPDDDGIPNYMEFAFFTDPLSPNAAPPAVSVDEGSHPVLTYQRHITAPNYYNFDIETSMDGDHWERLSNLETLTIRPIGALAESIVTRCLVDTHQLGLSFYRIRVTPRS